MIGTPRFSFGTNLFDDITTTASAVADSLAWLESRQRSPDGCWGDASMLEKVIATCHAVMAFQCCGYHYTEQPVAKGINFLTNGPGATSDWTFWRLGPLLGIDRFSGLTGNDLDDIKNRVMKGAEIHPDQILAIMALKANLVAPTLTLEEAKHFVDITLKEWTEGNAWRGRADTTANAVSTLEHYDFDNKDRILSASKNLIKKWARTKRDRVIWGANVSTAYVLYSIVESAMWDDSDLQNLAIQASSGLLLARRNDHWDAEEPPYGGKQDIVGQEFFTAAILRGICAVETRRAPSFPLEVQAAIRQKRESRTRTLEEEILRIQNEHKSTIDNEVDRRLQERTAALDVGKLAIKDLFSKLSIRSIAFLVSMIIGSGGIGWALANFAKQGHDPVATAIPDSSKLSQGEKPNVHPQAIEKPPTTLK